MKEIITVFSNKVLPLGLDVFLFSLTKGGKRKVLNKIGNHSPQ